MSALQLVAGLSNGGVLGFAVRARAKERGGTIELIAALMEIEKRRLYLDEGHPSLYSYCTRVLKLTEHAAYGRITAARVALRYPLAWRLLERGDVTLTTLNLLAPILTDTNCASLLREATNKSRREVEAIVARVNPRPRVPASIVPLAPGLYRLECTLAQQAHDDLRFAQDLLRHVSPSGDIGFLVERSLSLQARELRRSKLGETGQARPAPARSVNTRHIPISVQREVLRRDGAQCAFIGRLGRCESRTFLEFHHVRPFAEGGEATAENIELRCRAHNQHEARRHFGREFVFLDSVQTE